jgi:lysozyme
VNDLVDAELNQSQFDALVSWTYNLGPTNLKSSTLLKRLNSGDMEDVPHQIRRWNKAGGEVLDGLVRRREAEALLFKGEAWENV